MTHTYKTTHTNIPPRNPTCSPYISQDVSGPGRCHTPNHGAVGSVAEVSAEDTEQLLKVLQVDLLTLICFFVVFVQLDNPDEQAAQIRRELDGRLQMAEQIAKVK